MEFFINTANLSIIEKANKSGISVRKNICTFLIIKHPLTDISLAKFLEDAKKM